METRRRVHHVAQSKALTQIVGPDGDDRLAGLDSETYGQGEALVRLVELLDRGRDPQRAQQRPLRVVLVRDGRAEDRHDGVADELLRRAAEPLDLANDAGVVDGERVLDVFGVGQIERGGETDEVAEEDGHDLALHPLAPLRQSMAPCPFPRIGVGSSRAI